MWSLLWRDAVAAQNDIINGYTLAVRDDDGTIYVYFGMDLRTDPGEAAFGFWLMQDEVYPVCLDGSDAHAAGCQSGKFAGEHQDGDVLIQIDECGLGVVSVSSWSGDGADGELTNEVAVTNPVCKAGESGAMVCFFVFVVFHFHVDGANE